MRGKSILVVLATVWLAGVATSVGATDRGAGGERALKPRALSEAERAAVELAVAYLDRGPEAWWERLSVGSELRRLGHAAAVDEIVARAGPVEGATWTLLTPGPSFDRNTAIFGLEFASGIDETLVLRLVQEGGWKIAGIRTSGEPTNVRSPIPRSAPAGDPSHEKDAVAPTVTSGAARSGVFVGMALLGLGLVGGAAMLLLARGGRYGLAAGVGVAVIGLGAGVFLWSRVSGPTAPAPRIQEVAADVGFLRLGPLAPLRQALAAGSDREEIQRRLAMRASDPALADVQELWRAQYLLLQSDLTAVDGILARFKDSPKAPLAELLQARLDFRRLRREGTAGLYDHAVDHGLDHDALRLESALARSLIGEEDAAEVEVSLLTEMGSRMSEPWYMAVQIAVSEGKREEAEDLLHQAWQLQPAPRASLFGNPVLAFLVARPDLFPLFQLGNPEEPRPVPEGEAWPLDLPEGATAASCGQSLRLEVRGAELLVPGGGQLAPVGTVLEDAGAWSRHAETKALAVLPSLTGQGAGAAPGELLQPRGLRIAQTAAVALAERNRWSELLALTAPLVGDVERAPAVLVRLRAQALRHMEREEEARQLLIRLAKSDFADRRPAPGTLIQLAELFAAAGEYDTAIKLSQKADRQLPEPRGERRRKQLAMDRDLTASYASYRTQHFDVRYPRATGETYARGVALVLEEERKRLLRWIPRPGDKTIEVHLFPLREFFENYGGDVAVIGIFDGKVRVPFAELKSLDPRLVAILSHELSHALIAGATHDQAPHWFQEGLAEHVEMGMGRVNPLPDLARTHRALSFPTIDPILRGFAEPQLVDLAYSEAAWALHFIEARFGVKAIHRLLSAYAAGETTEEALASACGLSPAELDRAFWQWGTSAAPAVHDLEPRRYDLEYATLLRRERQQEMGSMLALGMSDEARAALARQQEETAEKRRRMAAWHAQYAARAAAVKRAFKPILQSRQGARVDIVPACGELATAATQMLGDPALWSSPDPTVNRDLRAAYRALADLGQACQSGGRENEVGFLFTEVDRALQEAARVLAPYGLVP